MLKKSNDAQGLANTRGEPTRRATARVLPGVPRPAADYFCRRRLRGYRSEYVLGRWRSPQAPRRQQRRGCSDRTSERSRDLVGARVVRDARRGGNWVCDASEAVNDTAQICVACFGFMEHATSIWTHSPILNHTKTTPPPKIRLVEIDVCMFFIPNDGV